MPEKDGKLYIHAECYECHRYGHFSYQFPNKQPKAINLAMIGVMLMKNGEVIKKAWIRLDTFRLKT